MVVVVCHISNDFIANVLKTKKNTDAKRINIMIPIHWIKLSSCSKNLYPLILLCIPPITIKRIESNTAEHTSDVKFSRASGFGSPFDPDVAMNIGK